MERTEQRWKELRGGWKVSFEIVKFRCSWKVLVEVDLVQSNDSFDPFEITYNIYIKVFIENIICLKKLVLGVS